MRIVAIAFVTSVLASVPGSVGAQERRVEAKLSDVRPLHAESLTLDDSYGFEFASMTKFVACYPRSNDARELVVWRIKTGERCLNRTASPGRFTLSSDGEWLARAEPYRAQSDSWGNFGSKEPIDSDIELIRVPPPERPDVRIHVYGRIVSMQFRSDRLLVSNECNPVNSRHSDRSALTLWRFGEDGMEVDTRIPIHGSGDTIPLLAEQTPGLGFRWNPDADPRSRRRTEFSTLNYRGRAVEWQPLPIRHDLNSKLPIAHALDQEWRRAAIFSRDWGECAVVDLSANNVAWTFPQRDLRSVAFPRDDHWLVGATRSGVHVWDIAARREVARITAPDKTLNVQLAPDASLVLFTGDGWAQVASLDLRETTSDE